MLLLLEHLSPAGNNLEAAAAAAAAAAVPLVDHPSPADEKRASNKTRPDHLSWLKGGELRERRGKERVMGRGRAGK